MESKKILVVIGTRPEAVKLCPLIAELKRRNAFCVRVLYTGQHEKMCSDTFHSFGIQPDRSFVSMREGSPPDAVAGAILSETGKILAAEQPDLVIVQGDTTTAFAAALSAFYRKIPVAHVEAGLRTYDLSAPFPEELHRQMVGLFADYHFAPTSSAAMHITGEGMEPSRVFAVGNTVTDALLVTVRRDFSSPLLERVSGKRLVLVTLHRRENAEAIPKILGTLKRVVGTYADDTFLLCEAHPNPAVFRAVTSALGDCPYAGIAPPLPVEEFHNLLARSYFVVTDSGGIQEEAAFLGIPTLIARKSTERPEGIGCGVLRLCGNDGEELETLVCQLLSDPAARERMAVRTGVYGDGHVSERIADILEKKLFYSASR